MFIEFAAVVVKELVHLFQSLPLCLGTQQPGPDDAEEAEDGKEHVRAVPDVLDHGGRDEADDEVEEPLAGLGKGRSFRTE